jgi:hypothetical protein
VKIADYQRSLRDVCLSLDPSARDLDALGSEGWRWREYRRMVRARFSETIDHCYARLVELLGKERFHGLVDRFFAEAPPRSLYLRDVPGEFLAFAEARLDALASSAPLPPFFLDLARLEWAELDTAYTFEESRAAEVVPFDMNLPAVLSPAHRVLRLTYPVHRAADPGALAELSRSPIALCLYREPTTHDVRTLELNPVAAALVEAMGRADRPLTELVRDVAAREGATIDVAFVDAFSALMADFSERGLLLGSLSSAA